MLKYVHRHGRPFATKALTFTTICGTTVRRFASANLVQVDLTGVVQGLACADLNAVEHAANGSRTRVYHWIYVWLSALHSNILENEALAAYFRSAVPWHCH